MPVRWYVSGLIPEGKQVPIATAGPASLISKEIRVVGSLDGNRQDAIETLNLAAKKVMKPRFRVETMSIATGFRADG